MEKESAVLFFTRLMKNYQLGVYRFTFPDFPEADLGFWRLLGIGLDKRYIPKNEEIASYTIYMVEDMFLWRYILLRLPQDDSILLIGPYLGESVSDQTIMAVMEEIGIPPARFADVRRYYQSMRIISNDSHLMPVLNTLGDTLWGEERFTMEMLTLRKDVFFNPEDLEGISGPSERQDISLIEKRYDIEGKLMYAIAHGQTHQASAILSLIHPDQMDKRNNNPLRNIKNYAIICNTLM